VIDAGLAPPPDDSDYVNLARMLLCHNQIERVITPSPYRHARVANVYHRPVRRPPFDVRDEVLLGGPPRIRRRPDGDD
jgi:hypothetical protein